VYFDEKESCSFFETTLTGKEDLKKDANFDTMLIHSLSLLHLLCLYLFLKNYIKKNCHKPEFHY